MLIAKKGSTLARHWTSLIVLDNTRPERSNFIMPTTLLGHFISSSNWPITAQRQLCTAVVVVVQTQKKRWGWNSSPNGSRVTFEVPVESGIFVLVDGQDISELVHDSLNRRPGDVLGKHDLLHVTATVEIRGQSENERINICFHEIYSRI